MKALFSPVGTADPLTIIGDGPMLHLARYFRPDIITLFFSPKMREYECADHRFTRAIGLLRDSLDDGWNPEIRTIESPTNDVFKFDIFIPEFENSLRELAKVAGIDKILVNTSSGTPAMAEALVALGAFGQQDIELMQVKTPRGGVNQEGDREDPSVYDLETLWEINPDNEEGMACRAVTVASPNFREKLLLENVRGFVNACNYRAADSLAKQSRLISPEAKEMIEATADRFALRGQKASKVFAKSELAFNTNDRLAEYVSVLEVLCKECRWGDFMRALTPAVTETMLKCLRRNLADKRYLKSGSSQGNYELDVALIRADAKLKGIIGCGKGCYLNNTMLDKLIDKFCSEDEITKKTHMLYKFEHGTRNFFAHTLVPVSKKEIEGKGEMSISDALDCLLSLNGIKPCLYDRINKAICELLQKTVVGGR
ncbi:type III-A CRISPR-associated CARF protein Csm6 [Olsenella uli]|uniref:type III-A CRISPR-associated CARF protein Csm6 n=1 Tax=Olsenella uli TaxID=133926 RepID=UPI0028D5CE50|nr:hypothetical protein [Olsenella uli]